MALELNERLGCTPVGRVPVYCTLLDAARFLQAHGMPRSVSHMGRLAQPFFGPGIRRVRVPDLDIGTVDRVDDQIDDLWGDVEARRCVTVVRDRAYLAWRYGACPGERYEMLAGRRGGRMEGLIVYRAADSRGDAYMLELLARNDDRTTMAALVEAALRSLRAAAACRVTAVFAPGSAAGQAARANGLRPWLSRLWDMTLVVATEAGRSPRPECDVANWDFSLGDWLLH
jgi:hypothetical protein